MKKIIQMVIPAMKSFGKWFYCVDDSGQTWEIKIERRQTFVQFEQFIGSLRVGPEEELLDTAVRVLRNFATGKTTITYI